MPVKLRPVLDLFPINNGLDKEFDRFADLIKVSENILISSALTSDGDSIGAQLGVKSLIQNMMGSKSLNIRIINESPVPNRYRFLNASESIEVFDPAADLKANEFDLVITCDGGIERTGQVADILGGVSHKVLIDHHAIGSQMEYSARILDLEASSTCELVYNMFEYFGVPVSRQLAEALYVGIVFDTGFFKHSLTTARTHHVAAQMLKTGIDFSKISDRAILERSWGGQLLLKKLLDNMQRSKSGKIVSSYWTKADLDEIAFIDGDQEGMINQLYYIEGAQAVALFVEAEDGKVKVSFRSKGEVNVAEFARSLNSHGGGHKRAAGCMLEGSIEKVRSDVLKKLEDSVN